MVTVTPPETTRIGLLPSLTSLHVIIEAEPRNAILITRDAREETVLHIELVTIHIT